MTAQNVIKRADRQIDAGGDDHEGAGDRQHAVDGGGLQDVDHVVGLHECGRCEAEIDQQQHEAREGEQLLQRRRARAAGA